MCAHGRKSGAVLLDDKVAILVDGAFYRRRAYHLFGDKPPKDRAEELVAYCTRHLTVSGYRSRLYRIFYYDCPPLSTNLYHPLHKRAIDMKKTETYIRYPAYPTGTSSWRRARASRARTLRAGSPIRGRRWMPMGTRFASATSCGTRAGGFTASLRAWTPGRS